MQEEAGSVEEPLDQTSDKTEPTVTEEQQNPAQKKSSKKKKDSVPTVDDVVTKETEAEEPVEKSEVPEADGQDSSNEAQAEDAESKEAPKVHVDDDNLDSEERAVLEQKYAELNLDTETALVETVLFLESEPQTMENLAKITRLSQDVVEECIGRLKEKYSQQDSGIEVSQIIGGWMLTPKKECFDFVKERYGKKNEGRLSKAAIETLSIIAYSQPITRAEIESIRHVNADNMMRLLLDRKFIKEVGKKDIPGKPILYGTTDDFLEFFHLQSIADLPQLDEKESERFELAR
ncbi:MAG: SMC-Scp complex subunit ScpB [Treponema sp.]|nr:SMC-Scp complex subunit ScpB [Treponema sp.]